MLICFAQMTVFLYGFMPCFLTPVGVGAFLVGRIRNRLMHSLNGNGRGSRSGKGSGRQFPLSSQGKGRGNQVSPEVDAMQISDPWVQYSGGATPAVAHRSSRDKACPTPTMWRIVVFESRCMPVSLSMPCITIVPS